MITLANRATPQPLTLEQQKTAMTSEGAAPAGQMPEPPPQPSRPATRSTLSLPRTPHGVSHADKS
jgi:hypothetical protein